MKRLFPLALFCIVAFPALAANHYVRSGATGNGSGSDWTNACPGFTGSCLVSSLVRGDTYYVASGKYGSLDLTTPVSGGLVITIKGATVADHGTSTGWSNTMSVDKTDGGAQAIFANPVYIENSNWTFDGGAGSMTNDPTAYGFRINSNGGDSLQVSIQSGSNTISNVTIGHLAIIGTNTDQVDNGLSLGSSHSSVSAYVHDFFATKGNNCIGGYTWHDTVIDHWYCQAQWTSSANHGDVIAEGGTGGANTANNIIRNGIMANEFTVLTGSQGTGGIIALMGSSTCNMNGWQIYGNLFTNVTGGNGIIGAGGDTQAVCNTKIYYNTIVNNSSVLLHACNSGASTCSQTSGNDIQSNVFWNTGGVVSDGFGAAVSHDYNTFVSAGSGAGESNQQVFSDASGTNTFMNPSALDFRPKDLTAVATGTPTITNAIYSPDMLGTARGAVGSWLRGALAFGTGGPTPQPPNAPSGLAALVQ